MLVLTHSLAHSVPHVPERVSYIYFYRGFTYGAYLASRRLLVLVMLEGVDAAGLTITECLLSALSLVSG